MRGWNDSEASKRKTQDKAEVKQNKGTLIRP